MKVYESSIGWAEEENMAPKALIDPESREIFEALAESLDSQIEVFRHSAVNQLRMACGLAYSKGRCFEEGKDDEDSI